MLTSALAAGILDSLGSLISWAGLSRAVTDAVGPVGFGAEAGNISSAAHELGVGNGGHVVDTCLL